MHCTINQSQKTVNTAHQCQKSSAECQLPWREPSRLVWCLHSRRRSNRSKHAVSYYQTTAMRSQSSPLHYADTGHVALCSGSWTCVVRRSTPSPVVNWVKYSHQCVSVTKLATHSGNNEYTVNACWNVLSDIL